MFQPNGAPVLIDVAYFLGGAAQRRATAALLARYHHQLLAGGVRDYSREQCPTDFRLGAARSLLSYIAAPRQLRLLLAACPGPA